MDDAFIGEIRMVAFGSDYYTPKGWMQCNGQLLSKTKYDALFYIIEYTYGMGDGGQKFALPDFRGRIPIHVSDAYHRGKKGGEESVSLTLSQMPSHTHQVSASNKYVKTAYPTDHVLAEGPAKYYKSSSTPTAMSERSVTTAGKGGGHNNMQPYLAVNFIICVTGGYMPSPD